MTRPTRARLAQLAAEPSAATVRRAAADALTQSLSHTGRRLHVEGHIFGDGRVTGSSPFGNGDDRRVAVGYLAQVAASLQGATVSLCDQGNAYAAAALVRQMVEVEYLLWTFQADHEDAAAWLAATPTERLRMWQPKHLRKRAAGRFNDRDYWSHCNLGGHPTPEGMRWLLDAPDTYPAAATLCEAIVHTSAAWRSVTTGWCDELDPAVTAALKAWRERDALANTLEEAASERT